MTEKAKQTQLWLPLIAVLLCIIAIQLGTHPSPPAADKPASKRPVAQTPSPAPPAPVVSDAQIDALAAHVARLKPSAAEEKWRQIRWRTDLLQARAEAQAEGKPIFLWMMDGHPMGLV